MRGPVLLSVLLFVVLGGDAYAAADVAQERTIVDDIAEFRWFIMKCIGVATPFIGFCLWYALRLQDKVNRKAIAGYEAQGRQDRMLNGGSSGGNNRRTSGSGDSSGNSSRSSSPAPTNKKPKLFGKGKIPAH